MKDKVLEKLCENLMRDLFLLTWYLVFGYREEYEEYENNPWGE